MPENRIRIREAIALAKSQGNTIKKKRLAGLIFPYTSERSAVVCLNNYELGKSTKMDCVQITEICKRLGCDPNFLFGWKEPMKYPEKENDPIE